MVAQSSNWNIIDTQITVTDRLDRTLSASIPELSRSRLKALIEAGAVTIYGRTIVEPAHRVKPGECYRLCLPSPAPSIPQAQAMELSIVYEDDDLIVIDKPAGLVVHPAPGNRDKTLVNALIAHCGGSLSGIGGVIRPGIVHRIDKDTSGLLVVAKSSCAHTSLAMQFADHKVERSYLAVIKGAPCPASGEVNAAIGRDPHNRKRMAVVDRGRHSLTYYNVLRKFGSSPIVPLASLISCRLATGRTHQIRVHMAAIGHSLIGDTAYGGRVRRTAAASSLSLALETVCLKRQALHAASLGFIHPVKNKLMQFSSPLPEDIEVLVNALEKM